jgi:hypothetical protein
MEEEPCRIVLFWTAKSPGPEKWALLRAKKRTDLGLGVLYNPSLGSVVIRAIPRARD